MAIPITKMMGVTMQTKPMSKLYPKKGKPHIYKDQHGWSVVWVPRTVQEARLKKSFEFANKQV